MSWWQPREAGGLGRDSGTFLHLAVDKPRSRALGTSLDRAAVQVPGEAGAEKCSRSYPRTLGWGSTLLL